MSNIFQGQRVRLRAVEPTDWEVHYQWDFDTDSARLSSDIWFPQSRETTRAWAEEQSKRRPDDDIFRFQIERLDGGELVGTLNIHTTNLRCGTFMYGIAIMPEYRRKGYASEAIWLAVRYMFQERRYQKVTAEVYSFNEASARLHERMGFTLEGRLRQMIYTGGEYHDALIYGLTKEEFESSAWGQGQQSSS
jgi:RimJ/RimL family protein N-acetyltransferase